MGSIRGWKAILPMRIYPDGVWFRHTGIGRIYENLLLGLIEAGEVEHIHTIVSDSKRSEFIQKFSYGKVLPRFVNYPLRLSRDPQEGMGSQESGTKTGRLLLPFFQRFLFARWQGRVDGVRPDPADHVFRSPLAHADEVSICCATRPEEICQDGVHITGNGRSRSERIRCRNRYPRGDLSPHGISGGGRFCRG